MSLLNNSALVEGSQSMSPNAGEGGGGGVEVEGSQPMSTAVHMEQK
jgi:hypothetical protein